MLSYFKAVKCRLYTSSPWPSSKISDVSQFVKNIRTKKRTSLFQRDMQNSPNMYFHSSLTLARQKHRKKRNGHISYCWCFRGINYSFGITSVKFENLGSATGDLRRTATRSEPLPWCFALVTLSQPNDLHWRHTGTVYNNSILCIKLLPWNSKLSNDHTYEPVCETQPSCVQTHDIQYFMFVCCLLS